MTDDTAPTRMFWDFFGPNAERTAEHFEKHLREFLTKNEISHIATGTMSAGDGHRAAYCDPDALHWESIARALRPARME